MTNYEYVPVHHFLQVSMQTSVHDILYQAVRMYYKTSNRETNYISNQSKTKQMEMNRKTKT